ncbi:MAG: hypothetical protein KIT84_11705 [Labilithrix sp.]|nr:hypothetical protein [Labilithrix sp.]MCW5811675.1 hypothetical protein [Labilithrix sp.]
MDEADQRAEVGLAASALVMTSAVAIAAKLAGVVIAPGARGIFGEREVVLVETIAGTLAYTLAGLLVALICAASFELARAKTVHVATRGSVVAVSGLVVALASPAVVERLPTLPSLALAVITSFAVVVAGLTVFRAPRTRAIGGVLALLAFGGLCRALAWETSAASFERGSMGLHDVARVLATIAVGTQALAALVAAGWIGTRSRWRGRVLANAAILAAFLVTWLAARGADSPSAFESVLRTSLPAAAAVTPAPYVLGSIAVFLVPASIFLALVLLFLREEPPLVTAPIGLVLLSSGVLDVPLHALLATAGAEWALLALATVERQRSGVQQPMSEPSLP